MFSIIKNGEWKKAFSLLDTASQMSDAIDWAVTKEAFEAQRRIVKGITSQSPGGQDFLPLSALTLAIRKARGFRGSKALIVTGSLRRSVTVKKLSPGVVFVGVLRTAKGSKSQPLFNIARMNEIGATITIRVTPKMHNYLMMMLRRAGFGNFKRRGRQKFDKAKFEGYQRTGRSNRTMIIRIPPRPFIFPVIEEMFRNPDEVATRLTKRVAYRLGWIHGQP